MESISGYDLDTDLTELDDEQRKGEKRIPVGVSIAVWLAFLVAAVLAAALATAIKDWYTPWIVALYTALQR